MLRTRILPLGLILLAPAMFALSPLVVSQGNEMPEVPAYTADGLLKLPENYREWVYLSSGFDMSYRPGRQAGQDDFGNVFVNPTAHRAFLRTGRWPDRTMFVLEVRSAQGKGSINASGHYQGTDILELEMHVKDEARFPGKWAFFAFGASPVGALLPTSADCYTCHAAHGAVDTTFVQFYPTLLPIARSHGTLSAAYQAENPSGIKAHQ
jgi:Cytochrome P460